MKKPNENADHARHITLGIGLILMMIGSVVISTRWSWTGLGICLTGWGLWLSFLAVRAENNARKDKKDSTP